MVRAGDDYQLFLFVADGLKGVFGKITGMRFSPVTISVRDGDFIGIAQQRHIHKRQRHGRIPRAG